MKKLLTLTATLLLMIHAASACVLLRLVYIGSWENTFENGMTILFNGDPFTVAPGVHLDLKKYDQFIMSSVNAEDESVVKIGSIPDPFELLPHFNAVVISSEFIPAEGCM